MEYDELSLKSQELQKLRKDWGYYHVDVTPFRYQWTLKNFRNCLKDSKSCISPTFIISSEFGESKWYLSADSRFKNESEHFGIFLVLKSKMNKKHKVSVRCSFSVLNCIWEKSCTHEIDLHEFDIEDDYGFPNYIPMKTIYDTEKKLLVNNSIRIICEGCLADSGPNIFASLQLKIPESCMSDDFMTLLDGGMFSDVTMTVSKREFKVHKAILASRSPVFRAMFSHDMEETTTGKVVIDDIEEDVFEELLRFVYTGKPLNLEKVSDRLLIAADKYVLPRLKIMCEQDLINSLSIEKVASFYKLACIYNAKKLKVKTLHFLKDNKLDVIISNDWKCLTETHPDLVIDALYLLLINNS